MPTNLTENYLRLHLLNNEAVGVLRKTFLNIVSKICDGDVDKFLKAYENDIKTNPIVSITQRKILFPVNGRTNVEEWDMSLLCFILTTCCSQERTKHVKNLRDLMINQMSTDTDVFLATNKTRIDDMRREDEIDQDEYNNLYPHKKKSNLSEWGFHLLVRMLVVFCAGNNKRKLYDTLRSCIIRDVFLHLPNPNLSEYLKRKQTYCLKMLQNGKVSQEEYDQLFPKYSGNSDVNNWDDHLVEVVVINVCEYLAHGTVDAVNVVRQIRNEMVAHKGSAEIEKGKFLKTWTELYSAIMIIIKREVPSIEQKWTQTFNKLLEGPFDMTGAINILKEYYSKETQLFDCMKTLEDKTEVESRKRKAEYLCGQRERAKLMKINKVMAENVQYLVDQNKDMYTEPIDADVIDVRIVVSSGSKEAIEKTERMLRLSIHNLLKGKDAEVTIKTVIKLVEGITVDGGQVVDVQKGSILLRVKCCSLKGITNLLVHAESQELHQEMANEVKREIGEDISLGCGITDESKQTINSDLERIKTTYESRRPLVFADTALLIEDTADIAQSKIEEETTKETRSHLLLAEDSTDVIMTTSQKDPADKVPSESQLLAEPFTAASTTMKKDTNEIAVPDTEHDNIEDIPSQSIPKEESSATAVDDTTTLKAPHAEKIHTFAIQSPEDKYICEILSCTVLPSGDIVIGDRPNNNVKLFDKHYTYCDVLDLPGYPHDSCLSGEDNSEVLISSPYIQTVCRIKVGDDLKMKNKIVVRGRCWGITCCMVGIALVLEGDSDDVKYIQLLQHNGTYVRRLDPSIPFNNDSRLTSIMNGRQLVIADHSKSRLISLDVNTCKTMFGYNDKDLFKPGAVSSDSLDNIYVVGGNSNNVHMISCFGKKVGDILTHTDGLHKPNGLEYNRYEDTIIIQPHCDKNEMCVFKIVK